jgi:MarR family 2-MHQ and catechol resistance regulon transcriptional repressor
MSKGDKKRRRALEAYGTLQRAASMAAAHVDDAVHPFGLSASQYGVLDTLAERGPVHQQELAEALARSKAQMTAIIDALEGRGFVRRERHAVDRRFISVYLTEAGRVMLAEAAPARTEAIVSLMRELSGLLRVLDPQDDGAAESDDEPSDSESHDDEADSSADASDPAPLSVASESAEGAA